MYRYLVILFVLVGPSLISQVERTSAQWQEDLDYLANTIHTEYPFLFKKVTEKEFDAAIADLRSSIPGMKEHEIIVGFARIVALFKYGHTSFPLSGWRDQSLYDFHQMGYHLKQFSDGIFVQGVKKAYAQALGAKVLRIGETDVDRAVEKVKTAFPLENDQFFKAYGMPYLGNAEVLHATGVLPALSKEIILTLEKDGHVFSQAFGTVSKKEFPGSYTYVHENGEWLDARDHSAEAPLYLRRLDKIYFFEYLPEQKTAYVRLSQIQDEEDEPIPAFFDRVFNFIEENDVDKFVLDVRLNGGGNNYKNKPIVTGVIRSKINQPGKFFVITGGHTFSACQNLVNELDNYTEAIFVGEPTGENINFYGDNNKVTLPNSKWPVYLSFAWWQDKPQWENDQWLAPHLAVDMSFADYRNNHDPVLETILDFTADNYILDPMDHLTRLYMSGKVDSVYSEAHRMANDPLYAFFDFEGELNNAGYRIMGTGDARTAAEVFKLVVDLYPDSANAWSSLGEGLWKSGNIDKSKEAYEKAISLDPDGEIGNHAREMLRKVKSGAK